MTFQWFLAVLLCTCAIFGATNPSLYFPTQFDCEENGALSIHPVRIEDMNSDSYVKYRVGINMTAMNGRLSMATKTGLLVFEGDLYLSPTYRILGTLQNVQSAMSQLYYRPNLGFTGTDTISISMIGAYIEFGNLIPVYPPVSKSVSILVKPTVRVPYITGPAVINCFEDSNVTFSLKINSSTPMDSSAIVSIDIATERGAVDVSGCGISKDCHLTDYLSNINIALGKITYICKRGFSGVDTITAVIVEDGYSGETGPNITGNYSLTVVINAMRQPTEVSSPLIVDVDEDGIFLLNDIFISNNDQGESLSFTISTQTGSLTVLSTSTGPGPYKFRPSTADVLQKPSFQVQWSGLQSTLNRILSQTIYTPPLDWSGTDRLTIDVVDTRNFTVSNAVTVVVSPVDDLPTVYIAPSVWGQEDIAVAIPGGINFTDVDLAAHALLKICITTNNGQLTVHELVNMSSTLAASVKIIEGSATSTSSLVVIGELPGLNTAFANVTFLPSANVNIKQLQYGEITVVVQEFDAVIKMNVSDAVTASSRVYLQPVNDPPQLTTPPSLLVHEDQLLPITNIAISDADEQESPNALMKITLSCTYGVIDLTQLYNDNKFNSNLRFVSVLRSANVTFKGTLGAVNAAFTGSILYETLANSTVMDYLLLTVSDAEATVSAGIALAIMPTNDPPIIYAPTAVYGDEDRDVYIHGVSVYDPDFESDPIPNAFLSVSMHTLAGGSLQTWGTQVVWVNSSHDSKSTFIGPMAGINDALRHLRYIPKPNYYGMDTIFLEVSDLGHYGHPPVQALTANFSIAVILNPVLDCMVSVNNTYFDSRRGTSYEVTPVLAAAVTLVDRDNGFFSNVKMVVECRYCEWDLSALRNMSGLVILESSPLRATIGGSFPMLQRALSIIGYRGTYPNMIERVHVYLDYRCGAEVSFFIDPRVRPPSLNSTTSSYVWHLQEDTTAVINNSTKYAFDKNLRHKNCGINITWDPSVIFSVNLSVESGGLAQSSFSIVTTCIRVQELLNVLNVVPMANSNSMNGILTTVDVSVSSPSEHHGSDEQDVVSVSFAVYVAPVDDAPTITAPTSLSSVEDQVISLSGLSIQDVDIVEQLGHSSDSVEVTLCTSHGTVQLGAAFVYKLPPSHTPTEACLTTNNMRFRGSVENVNKALSTAVYAPISLWSGKDNLTVHVVGILAGRRQEEVAASASIELLISAVNNSPVMLCSNGRVVYVMEDSTTQPLVNCTVTDVDSSAVSVSVDVQAGRGTLGYAGQWANHIEINATLSQISSALAAVDYRTPANINVQSVGAIDIVVSITDGQSSTNYTVNVLVIPALDIPSVTAPAVINASMPITAPFLVRLSGIVIADVDAQRIAVNFSTFLGDLVVTAPLYGGIISSIPVNSRGSVLTLVGAISAINKAIASISYAPPPSYADGLTGINATLVISVANTVAGPATSTSLSIVIPKFAQSGYLSVASSSYIQALEGSDVSVSGVSVLGFSVVDWLVVVLQPSAGTLAVTVTDGPSWNSSSASLSLQGSVSIVNSLLKSVILTPPVNFNGVVLVNASIQSSTASYLTDPVHTEVYFWSVNSAPSVNYFYVRSGCKEGFPCLLRLELSDPDANELLCPHGQNKFKLKMTANVSGFFSVPKFTSIVLKQNSTSLVVMLLSAAVYNNRMLSVDFLPAPGVHGTVQFQVFVEDNGSCGLEGNISSLSALPVTTIAEIIQLKTPPLVALVNSPMPVNCVEDTICSFPPMTVQETYTLSYREVIVVTVSVVHGTFLPLTKSSAYVTVLFANASSISFSSFNSTSLGSLLSLLAYMPDPDFNGMWPDSDSGVRQKLILNPERDLETYTLAVHVADALTYAPLDGTSSQLNVRVSVGWVNDAPTISSQTSLVNILDPSKYSRIFSSSAADEISILSLSDPDEVDQVVFGAYQSKLMVTVTVSCSASDGGALTMSFHSSLGSGIQYVASNFVPSSVVVLNGTIDAVRSALQYVEFVPANMTVSQTTLQVRLC